MKITAVTDLKFEISCNRLELTHIMESLEANKRRLGRSYNKYVTKNDKQMANLIAESYNCIEDSLTELSKQLFRYSKPYKLEVLK